MFKKILNSILVFLHIRSKAVEVSVVNAAKADTAALASVASKLKP